MTPQAAEALLRAELASDSAVGKALVLFLQDAEVANYRQTSRVSDPYAMARTVGRGEGIHSILTRITPVKDLADPRQVPMTAEGN
jgi:hypothetical protein